MDKEPTICATCGAPLAEPPPDGAAVCPACASQTVDNFAQRNRQRRLFWWVFLTTPLIAFGAAFLNPGFMLFFASAGSLVAGFMLAGSITQNQNKMVLLGIACSLGVGVVYLGLFFVGCLVAISGMH